MQPKRVDPSAAYGQDFARWLEAQEAALRARSWTDVDSDNVAEELRSLGNSDRREIRSRLKVLMQHLLKLAVQPERVSRSWESTIDEQSARIRVILEDSPSLRNEIPGFMRKEYALARKHASRETRLTLRNFPAEPTTELQARVLDLLAGA